MTDSSVPALLARARARLEAGDADAAADAFAAAHCAAETADDPEGTALALLGGAQAAFAARRLSDAGRLGTRALQALSGLALPQAKQASELLVQVEHYRYLDPNA